MRAPLGFPLWDASSLDEYVRHYGARKVSPYEVGSVPSIHFTLGVRWYC